MRPSLLSLLCAAALSAGACAHAAEPPSATPTALFFSPLPQLMHPVGMDVIFGPDASVEDRIVSAIDSCKREVLINHYLLTSPRIMAALKRAFERKRFVMVLLDAKPAVKNYTTITDLRAMRVPVVAISRPADRWNNAKYIIIDRETVLVGTGDLTRSANRNDEVLLVMEEPSVVVSFYNHFVRQAFPQSQAPR